MQGHLKTNHIFYQYLKKCLEFVNHCQDHTIHKFTWHTDTGSLLSFLETVEHLGHERTYNLLRGPGFFSQGGGSTYSFDWSTWNFPLPSTETLRSSKVAYTTESGLIAPLLQCLMETAIDAEAKPVVDNAAVKVIPVARATDGMALKPGMQVDERTKQVIGTSLNVDIGFVKIHAEADPSFFKDKFVKEADVTCVSTLDGTVAMPIGVDYLTGKMDGREVYSSITTRCEQLQTCMLCLKRNKGPIVASGLCITENCEDCCSSKSLCEQCAVNGHEHWNPAFRQCNRCKADGVQCQRFACIANATDCEEKNKQALLQLKSATEDDSIAPALSQIVPVPDAVHLGKNLNGSFSNWYLRYEDSRFNKSMIRTLWKEPSEEVGKPLKDIITLKALRYRDRMDSHFVTDISNPKVRSVLQKVTITSHTLVPETYRNYDSNKVGVLSHPTQVCCGPDGTIFTVDTSKGTAVKARLHYPVDVDTVVKDLKKPQGVFFAGGVLFISDTDANRIVYSDLNHVTVLNVKAMKKAELLAECMTRGLVEEGSGETVPNLRKHLDRWLKQHTIPTNENKEVVIEPPIQKPGAICGDMSSFDRIFVSSLADGKVYQVEVVTDGAALHGTASAIVELGIDAVPSGLHWEGDDGVLYIADASVDGGIVAYSSASGEVQSILSNGSPTCQQVYDVTIAGGNLMYTDQSSRKLGVVEGGTGTYVIGISTRQPKSVDGSQYCAAFAQPLGVCAEGKSVFLCDAAAGRLKLVTPITGMISYLEALYDVYKAFGIHIKSEPTLPKAVNILGGVVEFLRKGEDHIRSSTGLTRTQLQGPDGAVASKTVDSTELLMNSLSSLQALLGTFEQAQYGEEIGMKSLLTLVCERFFSDMRARFEMPLMLQFAQLFGSNLRESLKRMTQCGFQYFTSRKSYYPAPEGLHFLSFPQMPVPTAVQMDSANLKKLRDFQKEHGQSVRQQSVRSFSTKDRPGTLPISAYLPKEPQVIPIMLSTKDHDLDDQIISSGELHVDDQVILPIGTTAAVHGTSCLVVTTGEVSSSQNVNVDLYQQSLTNCLQFVHPEKSTVHVNDLVVLEADNPSPFTLEISEEMYHLLASERNNDHELHQDIRDNTENTEREASLVIRSRRSRKVTTPGRFLD